MGLVKKYLYKDRLPNREMHNSRLFVDLAENIHIHYREYRTVFSLNEYFEYVDILNECTEDVKFFLSQNPDYKEGEYPTTLMIAGGKHRQLKFLENSPEPNKSFYYDDEFAIELQAETITDEIHIHYRDFRIAMDRIRFKKVAEGFQMALKKLDEYEMKHDYQRKKHSDREIESWNINNTQCFNSHVMGLEQVKLNNIESYWYKDLEKEWKPNQKAIETIITAMKNGESIAPIILSTEKDGRHLIIDGHHRYYASKVLKHESMSTIVTDMSFEESAKLRQVEVLLKEFDKKTNYKYAFTDFFKSFLGQKLNVFYRNLFRDQVNDMKHKEKKALEMKTHEKEAFEIFSKYIDKLDPNKNLVIYGYGKVGKNIYNKYKKIRRIESIIDQRLEGKNCDGRVAITLSEFDCTEPSVFVITVLNDSALEQVIAELIKNIRDGDVYITKHGLSS